MLLIQGSTVHVHVPLKLFIEYSDAMGSKQEGKVFVGGLSWETTDVKLKQYFENFGPVQEAFVSYDRRTRRPRGFGFVIFSDPAVVDKVVAQQHTIDRREVEAKKALPREESPVSKDLQAAASGQKTKKIFVGGLAGTVDEPSFKEYFEAFGKIEDAVVMYDHDNKRPRGFGFVTFAEEESVEAVFSKGKIHTIHDKEIEIKRAIPRDTGPLPSPKALYRSPLHDRAYGYKTPQSMNPKQSRPEYTIVGAGGYHPIKGIEGMAQPAMSSPLPSTEAAHGGVQSHAMVPGIPTNMLPTAHASPLGSMSSDASITGVSSHMNLNPQQQQTPSRIGMQPQSLQTAPVVASSHQPGHQHVVEPYSLAGAMQSVHMSRDTQSFSLEEQSQGLGLRDVQESHLSDINLQSVSEALEQLQQNNQQQGAGHSAQKSQGHLWS